MVQRYDSQKYMAGMFLIGPKDDGKFVKYEDYAVLESERDELIGLLNFYGIEDLNKAREYYREYNDD